MSHEEPVLSIQRATAAQVEGIMLVERHCFGRAWTREQYLTEILGSPHTWPVVALLDGQVVGFASLTCVGTQGYIPTLGVLTGHRRAGLGRRLLEELLAAAIRMGAAEVVLEVRVQNLAARQLYEQYGFESIGFRRSYYLEPPDDAVVMRWQREEPADG